jgi:hypothetical protein
MPVAVARRDRSPVLGEVEEARNAIAELSAAFQTRIDHRHANPIARRRLEWQAESSAYRPISSRLERSDRSVARNRRDERRA